MKLFQTAEAKLIADRKVLLHFNRNERSIEGYVVKETRHAYWLQKGKLLESETVAFDVEGTMIVPKSDVFFVQLLSPSAAA